MRIVRLVVFSASATLFAMPALGAPSYFIHFGQSGYPAQYDVTQGTPLEHSDAFIVGSTVLATTTFSGSAFAFPGHVGVKNHLQTYWPGAQAAARYDVTTKASANDFVISGPPGASVSGQLHLRVRAIFSLAGGYNGNAGHGARLNVDARAKFGQLGGFADYYFTNLDSHGTAYLAGNTGPALDASFVISGTFPIGTPFDVVIQLWSMDFTYGNGGVSPNPGYAECDAASSPDLGLFLEEVGGQVMTLPAGYTLNSASWHVADNHFQTLVDVEPSREVGTITLAAHPNPFSVASIVVFEQPRGAHVRLSVFDASGRLVRTLADEWRDAGTQRFQWDGRSDRGDAAPSGLYFLRAEAGEFAATRRIVRIRESVAQ